MVAVCVAAGAAVMEADAGAFFLENLRPPVLARFQMLLLVMLPLL